MWAVDYYYYLKYYAMRHQISQANSTKLDESIKQVNIFTGLVLGLSLLCSKICSLCFLAFPQFSAYYAHFYAF